MTKCSLHLPSLFCLLLIFFPNKLCRSNWGVRKEAWRSTLGHSYNPTVWVLCAWQEAVCRIHHRKCYGAHDKPQKPVECGVGGLLDALEVGAGCLRAWNTTCECVTSKSKSKVKVIFIHQSVHHQQCHQKFFVVMQTIILKKIKK
jgi:hypothetical protein